MKALIVWLLCGAITVPLVADCRFALWERRSSIDATAEFIGSADFNGDADPDVVGNSGTSLFLALNDGTGRLLPATQLYGGAITGAAVPHDLDGDGAMDVVFASGETLVVIPGNGDATFRAPVVSSIASASVTLRIAPLTLGPTPDIAALDAAGIVAIYANDGNASFTEVSRIDAGAGANAIALADFDADGANDVVVSYEDRALLNVYYGTPAGTFGPAVAVRGASETSGVHGIELTNDGLTDLVLYKKYARSVVTMRNLGARTFSDPLHYGTSRFFGQIAAGELTGDSYLDVATVFDVCSIWTGSGTGLGTLEYTTSSPPSDPGFCIATLDGSIAIADFDGDARNDAAVALVRDGGRASIDIHRNVCGDSVVKVTAPPLISAGQAANVTVVVRPPDTVPQLSSATGDVSIRKGETVVASGPLQSSAKLTIENLPVGEHSFVAEYAGDEQFEPNVSDPFTTKVTTATTTTTIAVDTPHEYGRSAKITVRVSSSTGTTPSGSIRLDVDDGGLGTSGSAPVLTHTGPSTLGEHRVIATFAGDANHPPSSATRTYMNTKQTPVVSVSPQSAVAGSPFDLSIRLEERYYVREWPTGTIRVRLGPVDETYTVPDYNSTVIPMAALSPGRYQLRVTYAGDELFEAVDTVQDFIVFPPSGMPLDARGTAEGVQVRWRPMLANVSRKLPGQPWSLAGGACCMNSFWFDQYPGPEQVYVYRMAPYYDSSTVSDADIAMRIAFTDDPLMPQRAIRAVHMQEIVRAANIVRTAAGLPLLDGASVVKGSVVSASFMNGLRNGINEARVTLGAVPFAFTRTITPGTVIHANDLQELREAVR